jgi:hypothetical protein
MNMNMYNMMNPNFQQNNPSMQKGFNNSQMGNFQGQGQGQKPQNANEGTSSQQNLQNSSTTNNHQIPFNKNSYYQGGQGKPCLRQTPKLHKLSTTKTSKIKIT